MKVLDNGKLQFEFCRQVKNSHNGQMQTLATSLSGTKEEWQIFLRELQDGLEKAEKKVPPKS